MSHTTTIGSVKITDIKAMEKAVADLKAEGINCELVQNQKPRMYYKDQGQVCDYVLKLNDSQYDVGFVKQEDGSYAPTFDEWNNYVGSQIGAACPLPDTREGRAQHQIGKFMQGYTKHATINQAQSQGYVVESCTIDDENNAIVTLAGM